MKSGADRGDLALLLKALAFAAHKHRDQRRKDAESSPYINHPIALADVLINEGGVTDVEVLCAALSTTTRSEEHTSELQSHSDLVCRLLLEKKKIKAIPHGIAAFISTYK